jgi:hypothetical protein
MQAFNLLAKLTMLTTTLIVCTFVLGAVIVISTVLDVIKNILKRY